MKLRALIRRKDSRRISEVRAVASEQVNAAAKARGVDDPDGGERMPGWLPYRLEQVRRERRRTS